jgi:hypothetical protein
MIMIVFGGMNSFNNFNKIRFNILFSFMVMVMVFICRFIELI